MENITLLVIAAIAVYFLFRAFTSTLDLVFKIVIGILILGFLGYTFFGWEDITGTEGMPINETKEELLEPVDTNQTIAAEVDETLIEMNVSTNATG